MSSPKLVWIGRVVSFLAVLPFVPSAAMKFMRTPQLVEGMAHLQLPESMILPLAILETACLLAYVLPQTAVLGAILLTGYLGGAIVTHLRIGEPVYTQVVLGILVWLGLFLRDPRLRELLPLRRAISR